MQDMSVDLARAGILFAAESSTSVILSGIGRENGRIEKSQSWRVFQQLDHAFEQTTGTTAIDTAMVEA